MTNRERVGKALDLLTAGLQPFVERELKEVHGQNWMDAAQQSFREGLVPKLCLGTPLVEALLRTAAVPQVKSEVQNHRSRASKRAFPSRAWERGDLLFRKLLVSWNAAEAGKEVRVDGPFVGVAAAHADERAILIGTEFSLTDSSVVPAMEFDSLLWKKHGKSEDFNFPSMKRGFPA